MCAIHQERINRLELELAEARALIRKQRDEIFYLEAKIESEQ